MAISPISGNYANRTADRMAAVNKNKDAATATQNEANKTKAPDKDTFVKSTEQKRLTAAQLEEIQNQQAASFQKMISNMMSNQADKANLAKNGLSAINADMISRLTVSPEQKLEAERAVSEDGEWGVKAVATRIMDMAMALSGGDSSKISTLRSAVEKGFREAGLQWGQDLPSICNDTYNEVNKRFDYWEQNGTMDGYVYAKAAKE